MQSKINKRNKLTAEQVREIRKELRNNHYHGINRDLADVYGVSACCISDIKTRKRWKFI
tara:strand:+ start:1090 stop:1266 length:177 start_codon:yes stop_codon:yes gene_type:complete